MRAAVLAGVMFALMVSMFAGAASAVGPDLRIEWEILDVDAIPVPVRLSLAGGGLENFETLDAIQVIWTVPDAVDHVPQFNVLGDLRVDVVFPDFGRYEVTADYFFNGEWEAQVAETVVVNLDAYKEGKARESYELLRDASTVFAGVSIAILATVLVVGFRRQAFFVAVSGVLAFAASLWLAPGPWIAIVRLIGA